MRVLHLIHSNSIGGAERVLLNGLPALKKIGVSVTLCVLEPTTGAYNPFVEEAEERGIHLIRIEDTGHVSPIQCLRLINILKHHAFDVLHVHGYRAAIYGLPAARLVRSKIIATKHGVLSRNPREKIVEKLECVISNQMDAVLPVADHLSESVRTHCKVLTNGIPLPPTESCAKPNVHPHRLLFVGRLSAEKNVEMLLYVIEHLRHSFPAIRLDIVGDGPERVALKLKTQELRIDDSVEFHGFCIPQMFYQRSDILVMSSLREGLPLVALEAMASKLPVMSTSVGGLPKLLGGDFPAGLLAPSGSVKEYSSQLRRLLCEPKLARGIGQNGRRRIEQKYSLGRWAQNHQQFYEEVTIPNAA